MLRMRIDRLITTKAYAQSKGSQSGMIPNKLRRVNVSTPVETKKASAIIIAQAPMSII